MREILERIEEARGKHLENVGVKHMADIVMSLEIIQMCGVIRAQLRERQTRDDTRALREANAR